MVSNYNYIEWYGIRILSIRWGAARKDDNKLISFVVVILMNYLKYILSIKLTGQGLSNTMFWRLYDIIPEIFSMNVNIDNVVIMKKIADD